MDIAKWLEKRVFSEQAKRNMSLGQKGKKVWNKGKIGVQKQPRGKDSPKWKGGSSTYFHTLARKMLNLKDKNLFVHHIDGNPANNKLDNLMIMTKAEHSRVHNFKHGKYSVIKFLGGNKPWT